MTQPTRKLPSFGERLVAAGAERGRLCVGIDPHPHLLEAWGLSVDVDGLRTFTLRCVEAFGETAAVVKPQVAFFSVSVRAASQFLRRPSRGSASRAV